MIVVRFVFQTEWGKADDVVEAFKQSADQMLSLAGPDAKVRIMTDLSGPFHTVVQELELESLAVWEELRGRVFAEPEFQNMQEAREMPFVSGRTEFYTLEASF